MFPHIRRRFAIGGLLKKPPGYSPVFVDVRTVLSYHHRLLAAYGFGNDSSPSVTAAYEVLRKNIAYFGAICSGERGENSMIRVATDIGVTFTDLV